MARNGKLSEQVEQAKYIYEKYNFVLSHFPDVTVRSFYPGYLTVHPFFISKSVNTCYTHLTFDSDKFRIIVIPHCKLEFEFNNKKEDIIIHSSPTKSLLAKIQKKIIYESNNMSRPRLFGQKIKEVQKVLKFARLTFNLKNNEFDDKMLDECRVHIMNFVKDNPGIIMDDKHLEPRLKKLLLFT